MVRLLASVGCALVLATLVRSTTIELNHSLGRVWPFSLDRCIASDTPGCQPGEPTFPPLFRRNDVLVGTPWHATPPA